MSNSITPSDIMCLKCGNIVTKWRYTGIQKKRYNQEERYCIKCQKKTKHIELKDYDTYIASLEFKDEDTLTEQEKKILKLKKKRW